MEGFQAPVKLPKRGLVADEELGGPVPEAHVPDVLLSLTKTWRLCQRSLLWRWGGDLGRDAVGPPVQRVELDLLGGAEGDGLDAGAVDELEDGNLSPSQ